MGHRTLKRVPLNFCWPTEKVWRGYINPYASPRSCDHCNGTGHNPETLRIEEEFYDHAGHGVRWIYDRSLVLDHQGEQQHVIIGDCRAWHDKITQDEVLALVQHNRLLEFTHTWIPSAGWKLKAWETKGFWCPVCLTAVPQLSPEHHSSFCTKCNKN